MVMMIDSARDLRQEMYAREVPEAREVRRREENFPRAPPRDCPSRLVPIAALVNIIRHLAANGSLSRVPCDVPCYRP